MSWVMEIGSYVTFFNVNHESQPCATKDHGDFCPDNYLVLEYVIFAPITPFQWKQVNS